MIVISELRNRQSLKIHTDFHIFQLQIYKIIYLKKIKILMVYYVFNFLFILAN